VGRTQENEIRSSFNAAMRAAADHGHEVEQWTLCIPTSMEPRTRRWWRGWQARQESAHAVTIRLWDESVLRNLLASEEAAVVRKEYYDAYQDAGPRRAAIRAWRVLVPGAVAALMIAGSVTAVLRPTPRTIHRRPPPQPQAHRHPPASLPAGRRPGGSRPALRRRPR
jgi:hypothetical protein